MSAEDSISYPQLREDNQEAITLFPPCRRDEILQTDVPIATKPSDQPLILTEGSLIYSLSGKHSRCPQFHPSVTKWTLIFSIWRKALNRSAINGWSKMWRILKVITNLSLRFSSCFLWAWISISFYYLLLELVEWYNENICCKKCQILYLCLLLNFELGFCGARSLLKAQWYYSCSL